jgi:hypothetical protein
VFGHAPAESDPSQGNMPRRRRWRVGAIGQPRTKALAKWPIPISSRWPMCLEDFGCILTLNEERQRVKPDLVELPWKEFSCLCPE